METQAAEYGWQVVEFEREGGDREVHVLPNHERDHHAQLGCWCEPKVTIEDDACPLVVHNEKN